MKRLIATCLCLCGLTCFTHAQESGDMDDISIPESLDINMDSLLNSWHLQYFSKVDEFCHDDSENVLYPDSIYRRRLERLYHLIPMTYNKEVRKCIDFYAGKRRDLVRYVLGMADYYFPVIEQVLEEEDLPLELKYLPIVESALNATALSRVGAGGLWQFMLPTGKIYGLEINSLVDERRDAIKSTRAACRYFKDMYNMFGDWHLALASFNCGPGGVKKAIRRANGKTDFWSIYPYLPRETRSYVPLFIAAAYITNYYCEHNICPVQTSLPLATDTVVVNNMLHFEQVTELLDIDIELLRLLNPQYRRDIIPGHIEPSVLKLPAAGAYSFIDIEDTVYIHRVEELLGNRLPLDVILSDKSATREKITYTAAARESLYAIADRYGVTAKDIRRWNQLGSNYVSKGKRLTLYVNNGGARFASAVQSTEAPAAAPKAVASKAAVPVQTTEQAREGYITYTVQSGDSLYTISRKYPGVSAGVLQKANNLSGTTIRPGQKLKIPVG